MSEFTIEDLGDGRFAVSGDVTFETAEKILKATETTFDDYTQLEIDLADVTASDSAGLALLLEWVTWANHSVREISFANIPDKIIAIARTTEVEPLLTRGERWSGFIHAPEED
ncbi:MAG: STAS domain-containing protein [Gammaproteobacteria bacterium]|nr:STAS domain-containing protein [Gammaproteobacteria bacterium]